MTKIQVFIKCKSIQVSADSSNNNGTFIKIKKVKFCWDLMEYFSSYILHAFPVSIVTLCYQHYTHFLWKLGFQLLNRSVIHFWDHQMVYETSVVIRNKAQFTRLFFLTFGSWLRCRVRGWVYDIIQLLFCVDAFSVQALIKTLLAEVNIQYIFTPFWKPPFSIKL